MALDHLQQLGCDRLHPGSQYSFEPVLKPLDLVDRTWMLSSTFCVRPGEVKLLDPTSASGPDNVKPGVGDVRLRVELLFGIDAALDLAAA